MGFQPGSPVEGQTSDAEHRDWRPPALAVFWQKLYVSVMSWLSILWRGDYPLAATFWTWAVTVGLLVNVVTSVLFLIFITQDLPWAALLIGYGVSLPYNAVALVGVWRAAARYDGPNIHADLARGTTVLLMAALSLT